MPPVWDIAPPSNIEVYAGDAFSYTLSKLIDSEGNELSLEVNYGTAVLFMTYSDK